MAADPSPGPSHGNLSECTILEQNEQTTFLGLTCFQKDEIGITATSMITQCVASALDKKQIAAHAFSLTKMEQEVLVSAPVVKHFNSGLVKCTNQKKKPVGDTIAE